MTELVAAPLLVMERDLFFVAKIRETLKAAGRMCVVVKSVEALQAHFADEPHPLLLLVHFGVEGLPWQEAIHMARAAGVSVLAFGSHVDLAAQSEARAAGATRIIPNSKLAADLLAQIDRTMERGANQSALTAPEEESENQS